MKRSIWTAICFVKETSAPNIIIGGYTQKNWGLLDKPQEKDVTVTTWAVLSLQSHEHSWAVVTKHSRYLTWRYSNLCISCMDTAYVRENTTPPKKIAVNKVQDSSNLGTWDFWWFYPWFYLEHLQVVVFCDRKSWVLSLCTGAIRPPLVRLVKIVGFFECNSLSKWEPNSGFLVTKKVHDFWWPIWTTVL